MFTSMSARGPDSGNCIRRISGYDGVQRRKRSRLGSVVFLAFLCLGIAPGTQAALVGDTVTFDNISSGLWGSPTVSGDALTFAPLDFRASAIGGPSIDFTVGAVEFDISAQPGYLITGLSFQEGGDSFLLGDGITEVDGTLVAGTSRYDINFSTYGDRFEGPGGTDTARPPWEGFASVDLSGSPVESLRIVLENEFLAIALGALDMADINKELAVLEVHTSVVPLPPAVLLFGSALVFMVGIGRRRAKAV